MKLSWTDRYCNMQYLKRINGVTIHQRHFIALRLFEDGLYMVTYTDLHKKAHLHESNFGYDMQFVGTLIDCTFTVEGWIQELNIK